LLVLISTHTRTHLWNKLSLINFDYQEMTMFKSTFTYILISAPIALLCGCLGGLAGTSAPSLLTYNASAYFNKTAVGNNWNLTGTFTETGLATSAGTISDTYRVTALAGGVMTQTDSTSINSATPTPLTSTNYLAADGSYVSVTGATTFTNLPATFSVGTSWTAQPATLSAPAVTGTILGINVTCSSNNTTFTDCIHVTFIGSDSGTGTVGNLLPYRFNSPYVLDYYYSPTVGQYVQANYSSITTYTGSQIGTLTYTYSEVLQAGYVAL
jgi:hypothetical protein